MKTESTINVDLKIILFKEDEMHLAYLPTFNLTGYGKTEKQALTSLRVVVKEFLEHNNQTNSPKTKNTIKKASITVQKVATKKSMSKKSSLEALDKAFKYAQKHNLDFSYLAND